ncbi:MAG TPA: serine/threonine-protein kinase, partial [Kofleriaceae bacterium]|nr:serine/threonine-protein kinase [Kofleriaceae bacterium]
LLAWNLGILAQVLNAIRFAHSRGVLHRDLKPSNVMIGDFGEVYLLDWGVAVSLRDDGSGRLPLAADAKQIAGTPCYMAPEMLQLDGEVPLSERTDVYLAGAVLFEIIAGRPPHIGKTALAVMTSVLTSKPELAADAPTELAAICMRALDADASKRFESADALRLALQRYLEHRGSDLILARARARLDELIEKLAAKVDNRERHHEQIYRLLGECRFGFHEALAVWRDNVEARRGVVRATMAVAEYELASGDAATAVTLLSELDEPPELLARARAVAAERASRRAQLEQLGKAHDLAIGQRSRGILAATIGLFYTITPLIPALRATTYPKQLLSSIGAVIVISLWIWLRRAQLGMTLVNRRLLTAFVFVFVAQGLMVTGGWIAGTTMLTMQTHMMFLYFLGTGLASAMIDKHLIPSALGFAAGFIVASFYPEHWMYAKSGSALAFTLNILWAWRLIGHPDAETS